MGPAQNTKGRIHLLEWTHIRLKAKLVSPLVLTNHDCSCASHKELDLACLHLTVSI